MHMPGDVMSNGLGDKTIKFGPCFCLTEHLVCLAADFPMAGSAGEDKCNMQLSTYVV